MGRTTQYANGYTRDCPSQGQMHEKGDIINPLPTIGRKVIVENYRIKSKNALALERDEEGYVVSSSYMDCFGRPRIYEVIMYTHGIDAPYDPRNSVVLKTMIGGHELRQTIKTADIVSGYMRLINAPAEGEIKHNAD